MLECLFLILGFTSCVLALWLIFSEDTDQRVERLEAELDALRSVHRLTVEAHRARLEMRRLRGMSGFPSGPDSSDAFDVGVGDDQ